MGKLARKNIELHQINDLSVLTGNKMTKMFRISSNITFELSNTYDICIAFSLSPERLKYQLFVCDIRTHYIVHVNAW